jgi:hypothetical protein
MEVTRVGESGSGWSAVDGFSGAQKERGVEVDGFDVIPVMWIVIGITASS